MDNKMGWMAVPSPAEKEKEGRLSWDQTTR